MRDGRKAKGDARSASERSGSYHFLCSAHTSLRQSAPYRRIAGRSRVRSSRVCLPALSLTPCAPPLVAKGMVARKADAFQAHVVPPTGQRTLRERTGRNARPVLRSFGRFLGTRAGAVPFPAADRAVERPPGSRGGPQYARQLCIDLLATRDEVLYPCDLRVNVRCTHLLPSMVLRLTAPLADCQGAVKRCVSGVALMSGSTGGIALKRN
jgi:hypothetical protein